MELSEVEETNIMLIQILTMDYSLDLFLPMIPNIHVTITSLEVSLVAT
jgi:hypothetical protein